MNARQLAAPFFIAALSIAMGTSATAQTTVARVEPRGTIQRLQNAWFDTTFPIPVMHLEGSIEEVAANHGRFAAAHPHGQDTVRYLASMVHERIASDRLVSMIPFASHIIDWAYRLAIRNPLIQQTPVEYQRALRQFSKTLGISEDVVFDALTLPDGALRAIAMLYNHEMDLAPPSPFGCTSIIWSEGHANALHGRNLDYEGIGVWDQNQVILHVIPKEGLAYVAITALGVHSPGITAFNEAGIALGVHMLTLDNSIAKGTPMPVIAAEIVRQARTIDEAIAIIRSFPRAGSWAYVLSGGNDHAVVEASSNEIAVRRSSERFFYQTNHVSSHALANHEIFYSPGARLDSIERAERLNELSRSSEARAWATPERMLEMLADYSTTHSVRVAGGITAKLEGIQSVVMSPSRRTLWIGLPNRNLGPGEGVFAKYRWVDLRSSRPPIVEQEAIVRRPMAKLGDIRLQLRQLLRESVTVFTPPERKLQLLRQYGAIVTDSRKNSAQVSGAWSGLFMRLFHELKYGEKSEQAAARLVDTANLILSDPELATATASARFRLALAHLFKARLLDLSGNRTQAIIEYGQAREFSPYERVSRAANRGLNAPYSWSKARGLSIDYSGIDLFHY